MVSTTGHAEGPFFLGSATQNLRSGLKSLILHHLGHARVIPGDILLENRVGGNGITQICLASHYLFMMPDGDLCNTHLKSHMRIQEPKPSHESDWPDNMMALQPLCHHANLRDQKQANLPKTSTHSHKTPFQWWSFITWYLWRNAKKQTSWYSL